MQLQHERLKALDVVLSLDYFETEILNSKQIKISQCVHTIQVSPPGKRILRHRSIPRH